jgi:hypothetical protein
MVRSVLLLLLSLSILFNSARCAERSPAEILSEIREQGNNASTKLFEELARQKSDKALEALIEGLDAISKASKVCAGYKVFVHFRGVPKVEEKAAAYLAVCAGKNKRQLALHAVLRLGALWPASRRELVELALEHPAAESRSVALMNLVDHGMSLETKVLKRFTRSKDPAVRYEGFLALAAQEEDAAERHRAIVKLERSRDEIKRLVAVELLATNDVPERFELLSEHLDDEDPCVARKTIASLERTRDKTAIGILVAHLSSADRAARYRIAGSLERLTGLSLGTEPDRWQRWWETEGPTFELPAAPAKLEKKGATEQRTVSFYGLPIFADDLVFAIDTSDSMKQPSAGEGGDSRMAVAKRELGQAIEGLSESGSFDIVNFGKSAWSWKGELVSASSRNKRAAQKHVEYLRYSWGTELYVALEHAFQDRRADTIILLTDGDPQLSVMMDRGALRRIVTQWNRSRHTTIDCLSIGTNRVWLQKLAEESGGRYKRIE